jgi:hypothetical protein
MIPYIDAGFLLTSLVRGRGSPTSNAILRQLDAPVPLNSLHFLQVENFLFQNRFSEDAAHRDFEAQAQRTWNQYLSEEIFIETGPEWERAFALARQWNQRRQFHPTAPLLLLFSILPWRCSLNPLIS